MEPVVVEQELIEKKLRDLSTKKSAYFKDFQSLKNIQAPADLHLLHKSKREAATRRNAEFLQEIDIEAAKLHMKRLCPLDEKLKELRQKYILNP